VGRQLRNATLVIAAAALGGCVVDEPRSAPVDPAKPGGADTCGMADFRHLMGRPASEIDQASLPPRTRIITPDMMVTQDYVPERLNIMTGTDGRVASLRCF
jgi:hypothetical protein